MTHISQTQAAQIQAAGTQAAWTRAAIWTALVALAGLGVIAAGPLARPAIAADFHGPIPSIRLAGSEPAGSESSGAGAAGATAIPQTGLPLADGPLTFDTNLGLIERATAQAVQEALDGITLEPGSDILLHPMTTSEGQWFVEDAIARLLTSRGYRVHLLDTEKPATPPPASPAGSTGGSGSLSDMVNAGHAGNTTGGAPSDSSAAAPVTPADSTATTGSNAPPPPIKDPADYVPDLTTPAGRRANAARLAQLAAATAVPPGTPVPFPDKAGLVLSYRIVEFGVTYHDSWRRGFMGPRVVERLASVDLYTRLVNGSAQNVVWAGRGRAERLDVVPQAKLDLLEGRTYPFTPPKLQTRSLSRLAEPVLVTGIITGLVFLFYSSQN